MRNTDLKTQIMTGYEIKEGTIKSSSGKVVSNFTTYHVYQDEGDNRIYCHCYSDYDEMILTHPELALIKEVVKN